MKVLIALRYQYSSEWNLLEKTQAYLIQKWTKSEVFHSELVVNDKWISAHLDGIQINDLNPELDTNNWIYIPINISITKEQEENFWEFIYNQEGKSYDWKGIILSQVFRFNLHSNDKWFCSEIVIKCLQFLGNKKALCSTPHMMSPADLYSLYSK